MIGKGDMISSSVLVVDPFAIAIFFREEGRGMPWQIAKEPIDRNENRPEVELQGEGESCAVRLWKIADFSRPLRRRSTCPLCRSIRRNTIRV